MTGNQIYATGWMAGLLMVTGLVLCFTSPTLGTKKASIWLQNQQGGMADTSLYISIIENNIGMFIALGSILFAAGLLSAIGMYFMVLILGKKEDSRAIEQPDIQP